MSRGAATDYSNARLIEECLQHNEQAWHALVDRYRRLVASIPRRMGIPHEDAADIFQAVFLDLFNELPRLREPQALLSWLISVTTHKCYRWRRGREMLSTQSDKSWLEMIDEETPIMPEQLAKLETERAVREAIAGLPPRCREMIELLFFAHPPMRYRDIAKRLRLAPGSIGFIRGRCLKRLKETLERKGF
jgi:RNA polymerase sigma factor (sigma-70 family)